MNKKNRRKDIDFLRIISSFMVVLLHASAMGSLIAGEKGFFVNTVLNSVTRFCVPVFVMISGYFMLGQKKDESFYIKKSIKYICIMLLWSLIYLLKYALTGALSFKGIKEVILYLFTEPVHLWYFYALAALTLLTPFLSEFAQNSDKKRYIYVLFVTGFLGCVVNPLLKIDTTGILAVLLDKAKISSVTAFIAYFLFGYFVKKFGFNKKMALFMILCGVFSTTFLTLLISCRKGVLAENFLSFYALNNAIYAAGVFAFFEGREIKKKSFINNISPLTGGIYGVHIVFLGSIYERLSFIKYDILKTPLCALLTFSLSAAVVFIFKKIKRFIKKPVTHL